MPPQKQKARRRTVGPLRLDRLPLSASFCIRLPYLALSGLWSLTAETHTAFPGKAALEESSAEDEKRRRMFNFVSVALAHSSHDLLGPDGMTLAQAVDCPSAEMRAQVLSPPLCWPLAYNRHNLEHHKKTQSLHNFKSGYHTGLLSPEADGHQVSLQTALMAALLRQRWLPEVFWLLACIPIIKSRLAMSTIAVQALQRLAENAASNQNTAAFLGRALVRRLQDDDWTVLDACLACGPLHQRLSSAELAPLLARVVEAGAAAKPLPKTSATVSPCKVAAKVRLEALPVPLLLPGNGTAICTAVLRTWHDNIRCNGCHTAMTASPLLCGE